MNKNLPLYIYGSTIIFSGLFLLFLDNGIFEVIKFNMGIAFTAGAFFAFITALSRQRKQVQFVYHELHAFAMLVYAVALLFFCNSFEAMISYTTFLLFFYTFSEIIFCYWLFNLLEKVVFRIVAIRLLLGFTVGVGTIAAMNYTEYALHVFGVLFILVGLNVLYYVPVIRTSRSIENSSQVLM
jgi:hypothetical protein